MRVHVKMNSKKKSGYEVEEREDGFFYGKQRNTIVRHVVNRRYDFSWNGDDNIKCEHTLIWKFKSNNVTWNIWFYLQFTIIFRKSYFVRLHFVLYYFTCGNTTTVMNKIKLKLLQNGISTIITNTIHYLDQSIIRSILLNYYIFGITDNLNLFPSNICPFQKIKCQARRSNTRDKRNQTYRI